MTALYTECPKITLPSPMLFDESTIYRVSKNHFTESNVIRRKHYIPSVQKSLYRVQCHMTKKLYTECPKINFTESNVIWRKHYILSVPKLTSQSPMSYDENTIYRVSQNSLYRFQCHMTKILYTECPKIHFTESHVIRRKHYIPSVPKSLYRFQRHKTKTLYTECPKINFTESNVIRRKHYIPSVPKITLPSSMSYDENTIYRVSQKSLYRVQCHMTKALYTECPKIHFTESSVLWRKHYIPSIPKFTLPSPVSCDENTIYRVSQNSLYRVQCLMSKTLYTECPKIRFTESLSVIIFSRIHVLKTVLTQVLVSVVTCYCQILVVVGWL